jgi:isocitrate dehydrogenase kinase/phosphatase
MPSGQPSPSAQAVDVIAHAFNTYMEQFNAITCRAQGRFERREWLAGHADAVERLELYKAILAQAVPQVRQVLGEQLGSPEVWSAMKRDYVTRYIASRDDFNLGETFFNSVTRRIFSTVGVDPDIEFVDSDFECRTQQDLDSICYTYLPAMPFGPASTLQVVRQVLLDHPFAAGYEDLPRDLHRVAEAVEANLLQRRGESRFTRVEVYRSVFYRSNGAYLIGRIWSGDFSTPLVICLTHPSCGIVVDAVLMDEDEVSILFSFSHSYFHVEVQHPHELVAFLKMLMPLKRIAELYISIGFNKHGKTELYRDLLDHLACSQDPFTIARGERGMVMIVFSMESYDLVFKIIKDRIDPPKVTTRAEVMERYDLVFKHDRAGRLIDAQEFEHLRFDRRRFAPELLAELERVAPSTVRLEGERVVISHLYTERKLTPLDIHVREGERDAAAQAVIDYGQAIKDLANTDIFPGDVLLKNFGVTRHGRVVFYDYDELCRVTDCKFRRMPQPVSFDDEFEAEPWFYVGPMDIFPEEFRTFLGLQEPLRSVFIESHGDLFSVEFWKGVQRRHKAGEVLDIYPYSAHKRFINCI